MNMPLVLLNRRRRGNVFTPSGLFALAEPGVWYDPSDLTTLFTDTAGTTPVTTPGQTVALALDKSKGLVLGSEQIVNGSFSADADWTKINGATISGGVATLFNAATTPAVRQFRNFTLGRTYLVSLTWTGTISAGMGAYGSGDIRFLTNSTLGSWTGYVTLSAGTGSDFWVQAPVNSTATVDNISVRELPGFHATQATAASRPTYGIVPRTGRRNLLTRTEEFNDAVWVKSNATVTANAGAAPNEAVTADRAEATGANSLFYQIVTGLSNSTVYTLSVYVKSANVGASTILAFYTNGGGTTIATQAFTTTGNWQRITLTANSGTLSGQTWFALGGSNTFSTGEDLLVWGAQLETGSSATAYQRVGSAFDVTEAGVASLSYLSFDGVDDFMVTPTITPGIDKAQVFAGVRKLSDAASTMIVELSAIASSNNGAFYLTSTNSGGSSTWNSLVRGTSFTQAFVNTLPAPSTAVATATSDISGDVNTLRLNGAQVAQSATDLGTGNFLAYPLYIGRRGGSSLPFNGNLFSLIVRFGANLDANTITNTETWVAGKTGVTL